MRLLKVNNEISVRDEQSSGKCSDRQLKRHTCQEGNKKSIVDSIFVSKADNRRLCKAHSIP